MLGPWGYAWAGADGVALAQAQPGTGGWRLGYQQIGLLQIGLALLFLASLRLWRFAPAVVTPVAGGAAGPERPAPRRLALWLAPALFFLYAGVEVGTSLWAATVLVEQRQVDGATAGLWVSGFFAAIMGGRFATGLMSQRLGNRRLVRYGLLLAIGGAAVFSAGGTPAWLSLAALVALGLGCAPISPALMHEAAQRFDAATAQKVIGRQVGCAYTGCVLLPALLGWMGAVWGLALIMPLIAVTAVLLLWLSSALDNMT